MVKIVSFPLWNQLFASGAKRKAAQGAEQIDPLASLLCGCAIADFMIAALTDIQNRKGPTKPLSCFGFWLCGDGQFFCRPEDVDQFLECLYVAAAVPGFHQGLALKLSPPYALLGVAWPSPTSKGTRNRTGLQTEST